MGRVPARCVLLLEDLDAAFVRSTNREDDNNDENGGGNGNNGGGGGGGGGSNGWSGGSGDSGRSGDNGNGLDLFGAFGLGSSGGGGSGGGGFRSSRRRYGRELSDMNTLSLSGLLNALDGVAASEGRLLFAFVLFSITYQKKKLIYIH
jgi:chaperone BCS1